MSEFTKEYYQEKVEKLISSFYPSDNPLACKVFKRKLSYYEARVEYFESIECGAVLVEVMKQSILEETLR